MSNTIFETIKEELDRQFMTQQEVSDELNLTNSNFWKTIKNGKVQAHNLIKVCEFLKLDLYIVNESEETEMKLTKELY